MYQLILVIHVLAAVCLIALVLVQQGKGAAIGSAFGSGASQTVFGSRGTGSFLMKVTIGFMIVFFSTSIALNYMAVKMVKQENQVILPATTAPVPTSEIPTSNVPASSIPGLPPEGEK